MKTKKEIEDKIFELSNKIKNEENSVVVLTLLAHQTALKWVLN